MKHLTLLVMLVILLASCEKTITTEIEIQNDTIFIVDTVYINPNGLDYSYDIISITGTVSNYDGSYVANYLKYDCSIDFDNRIEYVDSDSTSFTYSLSNDTLSIDFESYLPINNWMQRTRITYSGDTLIIYPLDYGTNLTIKALKKYSL